MYKIECDTLFSLARVHKQDSVIGKTWRCVKHLTIEQKFQTPSCLIQARSSAETTFANVEL